MTTSRSKDPSMTDPEMAARLRQVAASMPRAYALVQGYPVTSFARVLPTGDLQFPADVWSNEQPLPFPLLFDIRVFHEESEWHWWRDSCRWEGRQRSQANPPEGCSALEPRTHVLWGNRVDSSRSDQHWICCTEDRGVRVYVPREAVSAAPDRLPFAIEVVEYARVDEDYTVRIEDMRLVRFALNEEIKRQQEVNGHE